MTDHVRNNHTPAWQMVIIVLQASLSLCLADACYEKTDLKVFVVVIPKEGLAGWGPQRRIGGLGAR